MIKTKKTFSILAILLVLFFSGWFFMRKINLYRYVGSQVLAEDDEAGDSEDNYSSSSTSSSSSSSKPKTETIYVPAVTATVPVPPQYEEADLSKIIAALNIYVTTTQVKIDELYFQGSSGNEFTDSLNEVKALIADAQVSNDAAHVAAVGIADPNNTVAGLAAILRDVKNKKSDAVNKLGQANQQLSGLNKSVDAALESNQVKLASLNDPSEDVTEHYKKVADQITQALILIAGSQQAADNQLQNIAQKYKSSNEKIYTLVNDLEGGGKVSEFFIGPDYKKIDELKTELDNNKNILQAAIDFINQSQNQAAMLVFNPLASMNNDQYAKLQQIADAKESEPSVFGWSRRLPRFFRH